ncbi:GNAT family N-acetyltransferase [Anaerococcus murdochii]|uniref:GNAT family N-acetyltransferase n=1 Tax=Anaerococcus murdochii TaxID=411577 RepID=A0ABS7T108_9FIRM|nr:GNAT family N-acetyltransferase [Anaerococcus murdochii]MBZ2387466.1 GNAT family N-acetyltransferase [Anaerococcus murdochii]
MNYFRMSEKDLDIITSLYVRYYNENEDGIWTFEKANKRIRQVLLTPDSYCLIQEVNGLYTGFLMGYIKEYDDLKSYFLEEIVVFKDYQNKGLGTLFISELQKQLLNRDVSMIELMSVNDAKHLNFYEKFSFEKTNNLLIMSKFI